MYFIGSSLCLLTSTVEPTHDEEKEDEVVGQGVLEHPGCKRPEPEPRWEVLLKVIRRLQRITMPDW